MIRINLNWHNLKWKLIKMWSSIVMRLGLRTIPLWPLKLRKFTKMEFKLYRQTLLELKMERFLG